MNGLEALKAIGELKENGVKINTTEEYKIVKDELKELKEFVRITRTNMLIAPCTIVCKAEFDLAKRVVEKYGKN